MEDAIPSGSPGAWEDAVGDMEATADAYEEAGWDAHQLNPGDTTILATDEERADLDVVLSGPEFESVTDLLDGGVRFVEYEVLKATEAGTVYVVVVMEDPDEEVVLLYPAMFPVEDAEDAVEEAEERGEFVVHLRGLETEPVEFVYEDPELFAPLDDAVDDAVEATDDDVAVEEADATADEREE